jgi:hypothetical protein
VFVRTKGGAIGYTNEVGTGIVILIDRIGPLIAIPEIVKGIANAVRIDMNHGAALNA